MKVYEAEVEEFEYYYTDLRSCGIDSLGVFSTKQKAKEAIVSWIKRRWKMLDAEKLKVGIAEILQSEEKKDYGYFYSDGGAQYYIRSKEVK